MPASLLTTSPLKAAVAGIGERQKFLVGKTVSLYFAGWQIGSSLQASAPGF